jgi:hypothetical protein
MYFALPMSSKPVLEVPGPLLASSEHNALPLQPSVRNVGNEDPAPGGATARSECPQGCYRGLPGSFTAARASPSAAAAASRDSDEHLEVQPDLPAPPLFGLPQPSPRFLGDPSFHFERTGDIHNRFTCLDPVDGFPALVCRELLRSPEPHAARLGALTTLARARADQCALERNGFERPTSRAPGFAAILAVIR